MHKLGLGVVLAVVGGIGVHATTIWNQSNYNTGNSALANQVFGPAGPQYTSYIVDDVVVDPGGWAIDSVTGYFLGGGLPATGTATLNVFSESGTLPLGTDDPTAGGTVNVVYTLQPDGSYSVTASGLNLNLTAGNYWIGLTPILDFGTYGQVYQFTTSSAVNGNPAAFINPNGGFGLGAAWRGASGINPALGDAAMLIDGVVTPEPATLVGTVGALMALAFFRRRRAS
jgi:hypothetical protein